jgi:membrane-associated phospholipid phosphatase
MRAALALSLALLTSALLPANAHAQPDEATAVSVDATQSPRAAPEPERPRRLVWRYPKFRWWEYAAAGAVSIGNLSLEYLYQTEPNEHRKGGILLDGSARRWLRADGKETRLLADDVSDYMWHGSTYYVLADGLLTPLVSDRLNTEVALQLTLLNWQAIGLTGLIARLTHVWVGRRRPMLEGCSDEPGAENACAIEGASFIGGHAMMTSANAGLACANHLSLPMYGGGIADDIVCPVMVTTALTVGMLRVVADKHWLSDTVPAWLLGGGIGFGLPYLLHYRYVRSVASPLPGTVLLPWADQTSGGLRFVGQL